MSAIIEKVTPIVTPIVESLGCELVDMEYVKEGKNWYLRIYADKPGRIDIDDCAAISEKLSEALDAIQPDPFPEAYFLEVSSPGAERPLKTPEAIAQAIGEYVHFDYYVPQHGEKQHEGFLLEITDETYELQVRIKTVTKQLSIDKKAVAKARLAIQF
ncbi:ribosome maturation factor RimP [Aerococcaceae bacterium zg-ZJ1578]|uniref:ribosome maturation factor RimP n=1 Tax=Aerococcaceae TaxID=186827 RepID=UPI0013B67083|nr:MULTISPECIES: ribosome maturation factor RimP [unclassified Facklamia]MBK0347377.1 ribosome maturation factor RimP [Aerococcaceae bacterium zg-1578]MBS4461857.1 ribosome maturation factor RimP [Aerococcaceae bacterium zg-B36]QQD66375.1 ribosome maturation factor RimP [Aerococcaceae bacterium zg-252]NEW63608.1 ribosome maturation factor RimP [Facklamia sp. 252]NEW67079.1 ribosome maturation factor RimP [Facklamia sp. 253]